MLDQTDMINDMNKNVLCVKTEYVRCLTSTGNVSSKMLIKSHQCLKHLGAVSILSRTGDQHKTTTSHLFMYRWTQHMLMLLLWPLLWLLQLLLSSSSSCVVLFVLFWFWFSCVLFWYTCEGSQPTPALVWVCTRWHCVFPTANYLDIFSWDVYVCTYIYIVIYCIWYYHYVVYILRCCIYVYLIHMYLQYIYMWQM